MREPTIRELLHRLRADCDHIRHRCSDIGCVGELDERVEAVLKLHVEEYHQDAGQICAECLEEWPCFTVRALNGEKV